MRVLSKQLKWKGCICGSVEDVNNARAEKPWLIHVGDPSTMQATMSFALSTQQDRMCTISTALEVVDSGSFSSQFHHGNNTTSSDRE